MGHGIAQICAINGRGVPAGRDDELLAKALENVGGKTFTLLAKNGIGKQEDVNSAVARDSSRAI